MRYDKIIYKLTDQRIPAATGIGLVGDILYNADFQKQFGSMLVSFSKTKLIMSSNAIFVHFAGHLTKHARRLFLAVSKSNAWAYTFLGLVQRFVRT